jgi:hypothetical protein
VNTAYNGPIPNMMAYPGFFIVGGMSGKMSDTPHKICANSISKMLSSGSL